MGDFKRLTENDLKCFRDVYKYRSDGDALTVWMLLHEVAALNAELADERATSKRWCEAAMYASERCEKQEAGNAALRRVRKALPVNALHNFKRALKCSPVRLCANDHTKLITDDEIEDALRAALGEYDNA